MLPLLVLAVAAFLRFFRLDSLPPGLLFDEAYNGVDVLRILNGERPLFLTDNFGREALFIYLQAFSVSVLGRTDFALRVVSAVVGLLTVVASYFLLRRMFGSRVAVVSSGWLAVSLWHVVFSRIGLRSISLPLFETIAFYCLWRGLERSLGPGFAAGSSGGSRLAEANRGTLGRHEGQARAFIWFALSGMAVGATLYTYTSARFVPVVLAALVIYLAIVYRSRIRPALPGLVLAGATALLVFLPEGLFFASHPEAFTNRANEVSIFNPKENGGSPLEALRISTARTLAMFALDGDHAWDRNIPGRPVFDPLSSAMAVLGLALALRRWRDPAHAFLLLWLVIMLLPSVLTARDVPNSLRVTGLIPGLFVLPGLGLAWLWGQWEAGVSPRLRPALVFLICLAFLAGSVVTYRDYFQVWARSPRVAAVFNSDRWAASEAALRLAPSLGLFYVAAGDADDPLPRYALLGQPGAELVRVFDSIRSFVSPPGGLEASYLIPDNRLPTASHLQQFFPGQPGQIIEAASAGQRMVLYRLSASGPQLAPQLPLAARFGEVLEVLGYDLTRDVKAGESLRITWYWRLLSADSRELAFTNRLLDTEGNRVGQRDDRAFPPSYWASGTVGVTTFTVDVNPNVPSGAYWPQVGVYERATQKRLPAIDLQGKSVGDDLFLPPVKVQGASQPAPAVGNPLRARLGDQIDLLGYDLDTRNVEPGDTLTVTLYWGPRGRPSRDYTVFVQLLDSGGKIQGQGDSPPQAGRYPTSLWDAGEVIADAHRVTVSPEAPPGDYRLVIGLYTPETGQRVPLVDESGGIMGDHVVIPGVAVK